MRHKKVRSGLDGSPTPTDSNLLFSLPVSIFVNVAPFLCSTELVGFRITSRHGALIVGPLIKNMSLVIVLKDRQDTLLVRRHTRRRSMECGSPVLYMVDQLTTLKLVIDSCEENVHAQDTIRTVMQYIGGLQHLRVLEVRGARDSRLYVELLRTLPRLSHLTMLVLEEGGTTPPPRRLVGDEAWAMTRAVALCRFPELKHLKLRGRFLWPSTRCPLGLFTIWGNNPQALRQLETVELALRIDDSTEDIQLVLAKGQADMAQRIASAGPKQLRTLRLSTLNGWLLGDFELAFLSGAANLEVVDLYGAADDVAPALLAAVAPQGGEGGLKELGEVDMDDYLPLLEVMQGGRLRNLRHLAVVTDGDSADLASDSLLDLFECLAEDGDVCPLLDTISLRGIKLAPYVSASLWDLVAAPRRTLRTVSLNFCQELPWPVWHKFSNGRRYHHLCQVDLTCSRVSSQTALGIIKDVQSECEVPGNVGLFLGLEETHMCETLQRLVSEYGDLVHTDAAKAVGLQCLELVKMPAYS